MPTTALFIGLISGTSADGIDAALISDGDDGMRPLHAMTLPYDSALKHDLDAALATPHSITAARAGQLDSAIGDAFAAAALALIDAAGIAAAEVTAIGSHGQTLFHAPDDAHPYTMQVGDAARIAAQTGITTVADFRRADVAAGGQGAPLAPLLHEHMMAGDAACRAVLNLGGIANVTLLQPGRATLGFDTGPANTLMDQWCALCGLADYDDGGRIAAQGRIDQQLLARLLDEPYFARPAPKSTGRELFNSDWLLQRVALDLPPSELQTQRQADIMATLCELSALTIAQAPGVAAAAPTDIVVCGGGARNATLIERIRAHLPGASLSDTARFGIDPDFVEATLFAWLARQRIAGRCVDTRHITGATAPIMAGCIHEPGRKTQA